MPGQTGLWFRMTSGAWKGYWLRASNVVFRLADRSSAGARRSRGRDRAVHWPIRTMVRGSAG